MTDQTKISADLNEASLENAYIHPGIDARKYFLEISEADRSVAMKIQFEYASLLPNGFEVNPKLKPFQWRLVQL